MNKAKQKSPETRMQQILTSAEVILMEDGIDNFTIDRVIADAQIAKGTVYKYYKSRDHLLAEMSVKSVKMLFGSFQDAVINIDSSIEKIKAVIITCYHFYRKYPQYYSLLNYFEKSDVNPEERERYLTISTELQGFIEKIIDEGKKSGEITVNISSTFIDYIIWSSTIGMIQFIENKKDLISNFKEINQDVLISDFTNMITAGLRN